MKITLKTKDWRPGKITIYGTRQTISADSAEGPIMLVYERDPRKPRAYSFRGVERVRSDPRSEIAGDLPPLVEHLPWTAVPKATWVRAMEQEQQRRSHYE